MFAKTYEFLQLRVVVLQLVEQRQQSVHDGDIVIVEFLQLAGDHLDAIHDTRTLGGGVQAWMILLQLFAIVFQLQIVNGRLLHEAGASVVGVLNRRLVG